MQSLQLQNPLGEKVSKEQGDRQEKSSRIYKIKSWKTIYLIIFGN